MDKEIITALNRRYATKKFDPTKKISPQNLTSLLEATRLTPTSYGLQLMKLVVVENPTVKAELFEHSFNQQQVKDASHVLVLCREKEIDESHIEAYISTISQTREIPTERLDGFKNMMINSILGMSNNDRNIWMDKQVYIALGNLLTSCAVLDIDSCPMEGFKAEAYDDILNLGAHNLTSILTIPVGYRSADDHNATIKKVRRSTTDFIIHI